MITITMPMILAVLGILILVVAGTLLSKRRGGKLNVEQFQQRWQELQKLCSTEATWPLAIIDADKLLDEALKKCRYRGKTMGERLMKAQRQLSDNDAVWFGHKLRNRLVHEEVKQLRQRDVQQALRGFRDALKDLGAL